MVYCIKNGGIKVIKIVRITTQKNNKERFNIYVDRGNGEEYGFSVDQDVLIEFQLRKGTQYSEEELKEILHKDEIKKSYNMSLNYLSFRMRSEKEIKDYLISKSYQVEIVDIVITKLRNNHYVNDMEFAKAFVRSRIKSSTKGPLMLRQELQKKGISETNIQEGLKEFRIEKQLEVAMYFAEKNKGQKKGLSEYQVKQKIGQALIAKGFSLELVKTALAKILFERDEEELLKAVTTQGNKAFKKYKEKFIGWELQQKVKQYLYQRGFKSEEIEMFITKHGKEFDK